MPELARASCRCSTGRRPTRARPHRASWSRPARIGAARCASRRALLDASYLFATSAAQYLDEWFESDDVKAALGWHAINDSLPGPSTPGTAYVLLHDHASEESGGGVRAGASSAAAWAR